MNDILPPQLLRVALTKVIVNYLGIRGLLTADGRQFAGISYLLDVLPPSINSPSRPIAHLLVDIGTFEARVVVGGGSDRGINCKTINLPCLDNIYF